MHPVIGSWLVGDVPGGHRHPRDRVADHEQHGAVRAASDRGLICTARREVARLRCASMFEIIDARGTLLPVPDRRAAIARGERMHRELRPHPRRATTSRHIELMFTQGAHLVHLVDEGEPRALAVWRVFRHDLLRPSPRSRGPPDRRAVRSRGYGKTLIGWLEARARAEAARRSRCTPRPTAIERIASIFARAFTSSHFTSASSSDRRSRERFS